MFCMSVVIPILLLIGRKIDIIKSANANTLSTPDFLFINKSPISVRFAKGFGVHGKKVHFPK